MPRTRPSTGLAWKSIPVYVGGALDTKTNPKLVQPGSLLELENMYQLKTGELRLRNGFAALSAPSSAAGGLDSLFAAPGGALAAFALNYGSFGLFKYNLARYQPTGTAASAGWKLTNPVDPFVLTPYQSPVATTAIAGIEASSVNTTTVSTDLVDPDFAVANGVSMATWLESGVLLANRYQARTIAGQSLDTDQFAAPPNSLNRPSITCAGGSSFFVVFYAAVSVPPSSINADVFTAGGLFTGSLNFGALSPAQPWIDVKPIPGGDLIAVAYRDNAGGVSCSILNPSTRTITVGPVNTAAADATMTLGWLDDSLATGNMYLATAGATAGVVVRTMSATTMVVSATNVIDATATTNIRQITGHINTSATNYVVFWDVNGTPTYFMKVKRAAWTGAAAVIDFAHSFGLYSRTFKMSDGAYYFVGSYDSTTQPTYSVLTTDSKSGTPARKFALMGQIMPGYAGGRRSVACSLASVSVVGSIAYLAMTRKQKLTTAGGDVLSLRGIVRAAITISTQLRRPRELGGTFFYPGGLITRNDGKLTDSAVFPFYPEAPTLVSSATGSMTAGGAYAYRIILKRTDSTGRISRSAGSVPALVTLGGGDGRVTLTLQNPRFMPTWQENYTIEIYRSGPAAAGAAGYNKVGEAFADSLGASDTLSFIDSMSDVNAALGETAYFTGNVLENFVTPASTLLEVCGNRVGIVNAEDPTEFWPSKEYKPGAGLGFNPLMAIRVTGDGYGGITALAAMDGRWVLFKSSAIYVISGDGPNDLGQGSFSAPQAVSLSVGTVIPGSVVSTPDGIMFQGSTGIYLLDRGLGLQYIGKEVEQYTLAANVVDASLVSGTSQVRFVMASGRRLDWDYHHKRWYTAQLVVSGSTVVACADSSQLGWCYALANGTVHQETPGVYTDPGNAAIVPRISFPHLNLAGLNGYQRVRGFDVLGDVVGNHTISVDCEFDYSGAVTGTARTKAQTGTAGFQIEYNPPEGKGKSSSIRPVITTSVLAAGSGAFKLTGLNVWVGIKRGGNVPASNRLT